MPRDDRKELGLLLGLLVVSAACSGDDGAATIDPDDLDRDGVANAVDNCPRHANADQHDEDGDGVGDVCDNCPDTANPTQADTTETVHQALPDGVGDACDRRPALGGDRIAAFYSFADPAQAGAFAGDGWTIEDGALRSASDAFALSLRGESGDGLVVVARVSALVWEPSGVGGLALSIDGDGIDAGLSCTLRPGESGDELVASEVGAASSTVSVPAAIDPEADQRLVAWRILTFGRDELICIVERGSRRSETRIELTDDLITGAYGIAARGTEVQIASLLVLTSPGPKSP
jgi:hypothetical protein